LIGCEITCPHKSERRKNKKKEKEKRKKKKEKEKRKKKKDHLFSSWIEVTRRS